MRCLAGTGSWATAARSSFRCSFSARAPARAADFVCAFASAFQRSARSVAFRAGVWPDSVQVIGGKLSMRLPTGGTGVAHYRSASRRSP